MGGRRHELSRRLSTAAIIVALISVVVAVVGGTNGVLAGLTVIPLAAASFASARVTALAGLAAIAVAVVAGLAHDSFDSAHVAALIALGVAAVMATVLAAEARGREREAAFATFLGEAGVLLACSLDFDETAKSAASVPVPELADWALVELTDQNGAIERRAASHPDEQSEEIAAALAASHSQGPGPLPELWSELPQELRDTGAVAGMRVPLRTPERRLGVLTLLTADSGRRYGARDVERAEELAARAAIAIENAQLYRAARRGERRFARRTESPAPGLSEPRTTDQ
jgi:GAF domain-containing protein